MWRRLKLTMDHLWLLYKNANSSEQLAVYVNTFCKGQALLNSKLLDNITGESLTNVVVTQQYTNINDFFAAVNAAVGSLSRAEYLKDDEVNYQPETVTVPLKDFLKTRVGIKITPREFLTELLPYLEDICDLVNAAEDDAYTKYWIRRTEWIFFNAFTLTEGLYKAATVYE